MKNVSKILTVLLMCGTMAVHAQMSMNELASLLETSWEGEGYQMTEQGERFEFTHSEVVTPKLDGKLITFNGTAVNKKTGEVGFKAFGVMYTDTETGKAKMHAWTDQGQYTHADVTFTEDGFYWEFTVPGGGTVRYTTTLTKTSWSETGRYSPNGEQWYPFMEMNLAKKGG